MARTYFQKDSVATAPPNPPNGTPPSPPPSRAALLRGRLPLRNGMCHDPRQVLFTNSAGGLPDGEITIAKALKDRGYATACVGKWHLGHLPQYLPTRHGFDSYFGIPYS